MDFALQVQAAGASYEFPGRLVFWYQVLYLVFSPLISIFLPKVVGLTGLKRGTFPGYFEMLFLAMCIL